MKDILKKVLEEEYELRKFGCEVDDCNKPIIGDVEILSGYTSHRCFDLCEEHYSILERAKNEAL